MARTCGTVSCYHAGCRCADCRRAMRLTRHRQRQASTVFSGRFELRSCLFCGELFTHPWLHEPVCART